MKLIHGGDWAGFETEYGKTPCRRVYTRRHCGRWKKLTATPIRFAGDFARHFRHITASRSQTSCAAAGRRI